MGLVVASAASEVADGQVRLGGAMLALGEYPPLVHQSLADHGDLVAADPARQPVAKYLTGSFIAERTNVSGIHRALAVTTN